MSGCGYIVSRDVQIQNRSKRQVNKQNTSAVLLFVCFEVTQYIPTANVHCKPYFYISAIKAYILHDINGNNIAVASVHAARKG